MKLALAESCAEPRVGDGLSGQGVPARSALAPSYTRRVRVDCQQRFSVVTTGAVFSVNAATAESRSHQVPLDYLLPLPLKQSPFAFDRTQRLLEKEIFDCGGKLN